MPKTWTCPACGYENAAPDVCEGCGEEQPAAKSKEEKGASENKKVS